MAEKIHWETVDQTSKVVAIPTICGKCNKKEIKYSLFRMQEDNINVAFLCETCIKPYIKKLEDKEGEFKAIGSEWRQSFIDSSELKRIGDTSMEAATYHQTEEEGVEGDRRISVGISQEEIEQLEATDQSEKEDKKEEFLSTKKSTPPEWINIILDASFSAVDAKEIANDQSMSLETKKHWFNYIQTSLGETNPFILTNLVKIFQELFAGEGNNMPEEYFKLIYKLSASEEMDKRKNAAVALSRIQGEKAVQLLNKMRDEEKEKNVRRVIEHGLKMARKK